MICIIYNATTGEIDGDCGICGIVGGVHEDEIRPALAPDHDCIMIDERECNPYELDASQTRYRYKIDTKTRKIIDTNS